MKLRLSLARVSFPYFRLVSSVVENQDNSLEGLLCCHVALLVAGDVLHSTSVTPGKGGPSHSKLLSVSDSGHVADEFFRSVGELHSVQLWVFQFKTPHAVQKWASECCGPRIFLLIKFCFSDPLERRVVRKEYLSGAYPLSTYYLAKITSDTPPVLLFPGLMVFGCYFLTGLTISPGNFFAFLFAFLLAPIVGQVRPKHSNKAVPSFSPHSFKSHNLRKCSSGSWNCNCNLHHRRTRFDAGSLTRVRSLQQHR